MALLQMDAVGHDDKLKPLKFFERCFRQDERHLVPRAWLQNLGQAELFLHVRAPRRI